MNLTDQVSQKNDRLLLRRVVLQQHLYVRAQTTELGPFLLTFVAAPLVVGVVAHRLLRWSGILPNSLQSAVFPLLRLIPFV